MALKLTNIAKGKLSAPIAAGDITVPMRPGDGAAFPTLATGDWFPVVAVKATGEYEIMKVVGRTGDVLTVTRAQESTAALAFSAGDIIELRATAGALTSSFDSKLDLTKFAAIMTGIVVMWSGAIVDIPAGWSLCDGTAGTPDLRDKFIVGAGHNYNVGATGGADTVTLTSDQMPSHAHGLSDPGHAHTIRDPGHAHGIYDPGHGHTSGGGGFVVAGAANNVNNSYNGPNNAEIRSQTDWSGTNIGIYSSTTGIGIYSATTGITMANAGGGQAHENRPPYYALAYIKYIG